MRIGFLGLLTIIFITLKLTGHIAWSWLLVLSPSLIGFVLFVVAIIVLAIMEPSGPSRRKF